MTHAFRGIITASWEPLEFCDPTEIICLNNRLFHLDLSVLEWCRGGMSDCLKVSNREIRGPRWKKKKGSLLARFWMMMTIWNTKILEQSQLSIPGSNFVWHFLFFFFFAFSREMFHCVKKKRWKARTHACPQKNLNQEAHTHWSQGSPKPPVPPQASSTTRSLAIFGMCFQSLLLLTSLHCTALRYAAPVHLDQVSFLDRDCPYISYGH